MTNIADTYVNEYQVAADVAVLRSRALRRGEVKDALEARACLRRRRALRGDLRQRRHGVLNQ